MKLMVNLKEKRHSEEHSFKQLLYVCMRHHYICTGILSQVRHLLEYVHLKSGHLQLVEDVLLDTGGGCGR